MKSRKSLWINAAVFGYLVTAAFGATAASLQKAERDQIRAEYKLNIEKCSSLDGNPKDVCKAQAKAIEDKREARLEADVKPSAKASRHMQEEYADADYRLAKTKCAALTGNDKDVCNKEAKAARVTALENARTNKEVLDRKNEAAGTKNNAEFAVAKEKCDALSGASKDKCIAEAKLSFGK